MRYVAKCLRELAFVAFRCGKYEDVPKHLEAAAELDRRAKKVIIENRYNDDQPRDDRGRWTDGGGGANETVTNAAGETVKVVDHINLKEKPNSITQKQNAKGGIDRNFYDKDGKQIKQISNHNHGHPKQHPYGVHGEHAHEYIWDDSGNFIRKTTRELNDQERKDEGDLL